MAVTCVQEYESIPVLSAGSLNQTRAPPASRNATAIKMKIGFLGPEIEETLIRDVRSIVGPIELRLDANQSIAASELQRELERLAPFEPVFLEEPAPKGPGWRGRTAHNLPVGLTIEGDDLAGRIVRARIGDATAFGLSAELVED